MIQWLRLGLPLQEVQVQSLIGELRSHMPRGQKNQNIKQKRIVKDSIKTLKMVHIKNFF